MASSNIPSFDNLLILSPLDELSNREWVELTSGQEKLINFCQTLGLISWTTKEPCNAGHTNWKLAVYSRSLDEFAWRCIICRSTRTIRDGTFFSNSKLTLRQVMDLMFYWSQGLDSHVFPSRHCGIKGDATLVDWKNFMRDICVEYCLKNPAMIGGVGHVVEIDESAWAKQKYNRG
jgi:hypothetical protein